ncbi:MAG: LysM peptidoglycan-binding domain-containing M23 family metallopeptidase [Pseudomonadota bacterium]
MISRASLRRKPRRAVSYLSSALICGVLAGCATLGPTAGPPVQTVPNAQPDARGVITYASYQVAVAQDGDSLSTVAARVGTTTSELAQVNALPADYMLRQGEVLLLPNSVPRPSGAEVLQSETIVTETLEWSPEAAAAAIESADGSGAGAPPANPFRRGQSEPLIDPIRHRVESGETAYSIARLYGVSVTALASWNGLDSDLTVRESQELLIPIVSDANRISGAAETRPGETTAVTAPAAASAPLPEDITTAGTPDSPNLGQYRTPPGGPLQAPVSGSITRPFSASTPNGVGFSVAAGTSVRAAADGEVALISEELGGVGTIVLIQHPDSLMTTYSTLSDVTVTRGQRVSAGQVIGQVAERDNPELQFDVFRGTDPVDPTPYLPR